MEENNLEKDGLPSANTPDPSYADKPTFDGKALAADLVKNQKQNKPAVAVGTGSNLDYNKFRKELGNDFQLNKGEKYLVGKYNKSVEAKQRAAAIKLSEEQGFFGELAAFTQQAASEIVFGAIEGAGYLMDWESVMTKGEEDDWGNWLSDWAKGMNESIAAANPIYLHPDDKGRFAMDSSAWWLSNGVSLASALSIMIPVAGWAKGVGMLGKAGKFAATAAKTSKFASKGKKIATAAATVSNKTSKSKKILNAVHQGVISRHIESSMEASGVYDEKYNDFIAQGFSDAEAKEYAAEGAAFSYRWNWAMVAQDIPQYLMLGRGMSPSKAISSMRLAKAAGKSPYKALAVAGKNSAAQFLGEGFEESYQFVVGQEGKHRADLAAGIIDENDTNFQDRLESYSKDSELWTSAFFGGLGGMAMSAASNIKTPKGVKKAQEWANNKLGRATGATKYVSEVDGRIEEIVNRNKNISANLQILRDTVEAGDERGMEAAKSRIGFELGYNAAQVGNLDLAIENLEALKKVKPEDMEELGFDEGFQENLDTHIAGMKRVGELFEKNTKKYSPETVQSITYREYMLEKYTDRFAVLESDISNMMEKVPNINALSDIGKTVFETKLEQKAKTRYIAAAEARIKNTKMPQAEKEAQLASIADVKAAHVKNTAILESLETDMLTPTDNLAISSLDGGFTEDLSIAKSEAIFLKNEQAQLVSEINYQTSKAGQKEMAEQRAAQVKKTVKKEKTAKTKAEHAVKNEELNDGLGKEEKTRALQGKLDKLSDEDLEDIQGQISRGELSPGKLPKELHKKLLDYKQRKLNGEVNDGGRNPNADHQAAQNAAVNHVPVETPSNEDGNTEADYTELNITTQNTPLAWLSVNNLRHMLPGMDTPLRKALTSFLETNLSTANIDILFSINMEYIKEQADKGVTKYQTMLDAINSGTIPEDLVGELPIKGDLMRKGVALTHQEQALSISLHDDSFFDGGKDPEMIASQKAKVLEDKRAVLEAHFNGEQVSTTIVGKTGGVLNISKDVNGEFAKNSIADETKQTPEEMEFVYGDSTDGYFNPNGEQSKELIEFGSATPGAIYTIVKKANGDLFPLRAHVNNVSMTEAALVYDIYVQTLENASKLKKGLDDALITKIKENPDPRIKGLATYLNLNTITHAELLNHLVFNGKNVTESKGESRLYIEPAGKVKGQSRPATLVYGAGNKKIDLDNLKSPEGKDLFINHLAENRRRQVDTKKLGDKKYKAYLDANGILFTNAKATPEGNLFIQPVPVYDSNLTTTKKTKVSTEVEVVSNNEFVGLVEKAVSEKELDTITEQATKADKYSPELLDVISKKRASFLSDKEQEAKEIEDYVDSQTDKTQEEIDDLDDFLSEDDEGESAFKSYTPDVAITHTPNRKGHEAEIAHITELLPKEFALKLQADYIKVLSDGKVVAGLFQDAMITISEQAGMGTAYHEAFHAVFRTLLNDEQRSSLINEAEGRYVEPTSAEVDTIMEDVGISSREEAINIYYEEHLADEFMSYMANPRYANKNNVYPKGIKGFFSKLMDWITGAFSNKATSRKLFLDISRGKFATKKPKMVRGMAFATKIPGFTAKEIRDTTKQLTYVAFKDVKSLDTVDAFNANHIITELRHLFKGAKATLAENPNDAAAKEQMSRIRGMFDGRNLLPVWENNIKKYIKSEFGLKEVKKIDTTEENQENEEGALNFLQSSYQVSGKASATETIKFLVAMTPDIKGYTNGQPVYNTDTMLGLPAFNDYSVTYNALENLLGGKVATEVNGEMQDIYQVMMDAMKAEFTYRPELRFLMDKLESMPDTIKSQFVFTFSRNRGEYINHIMAGAPKAIVAKVGESDINSKETTIRGTWAKVFADKFGIEVEGRMVYNALEINKFKAAYTELNDSIREAMTLKQNTPRVGQAFANILTELGVSMSNKALNKLILSEGFASSPTQPDFHVVKAIKMITTQLGKATAGLHDKAGKSLNVSTNLLLDEDTFFKNKLARIEGDFRKVSGENSFLGPDGNRIWPYQDNNSFSKTINEFKAGELTHLQDLQSSLWGRNSLWLNELLHTDKGEAARNAFKLGLYGNVKLESQGDKGDKASNLKFADTFVDQFNKQLKGWYIGLAEADKGQQSYFHGPKLRRSSVTSQDGKIVFSNSNPEVVSILSGYLSDELHRMQVAKKAIYGQEATETSEAVPALAPEKQILFYHYYPVAPGKGTFSSGNNEAGEPLMDRAEGNAFGSFLFPDLLDKSTVKENGVDIEQTQLEVLGLTDPEGNLVPLSRTIVEDNKALTDYLKKTFIKLVKSDIQTAVDTGVVDISNRQMNNRLIDLKSLDDRGGDVVNAIADYTLNSLIGNIEQTKMFNGDPALFKVKGANKGGVWSELDLFGDFRKRIPSTSASGKDFRMYKNEAGNWAVRPHYTSATISNIETPSSFFGEEVDGEIVFNKSNLSNISKSTGLPVAKLEELFKPYLETNVTDAQAWITLDVYKERLLGLGKWTPAHDDAYDAMTADEYTATPEQVKLLSTPLKTVHNELVKTNNEVMSLHYNKQSEAVLLPILTKGTQLDVLRLAMEDGGLGQGGPDHVIVVDGKKVGGRGITDITDGKGNIVANPKFTTSKLSYRRLFLQQDAKAKGIKQTMVGTQAVKNVLSVVDPTAMYGEINGADLINKYHDVISKLSDIGLESFQKEMGYTAEEGRDEGKLRKMLAREFENDLSDNHIEAILNGDNLDALPISKKIQNKLHAMLTSKTVKLKQLGGALVQLSDFGLVGTQVDLNESVKDGIVWLKEDPSKRLEPMKVDDEGTVHPAQILMPHSYLAKELKKQGIDIKGMSHTQVTEMIPKEVLAGFSYRIPNQGPSSNDAFEIVGILPEEVGDTMVAYSAITTKTGSDFDYDKAFVILPNFSIDKTGRVFYVKGDSPKGLENQRLEMMREMLMHPSAYAAVMTPLDDPWLSKLAAKLYPEKNKLSSLQFFSGNNQMKTKAIFDSAKSLVGSVANHSAHHALALSEGLFFNDYYLGLGMTVNSNSTNLETSISNKLDEDGREVANTLVAYMNAIVDAAKDPFITRANINQFTANTAFMLTRAGVSREWVTSFMGQPIIKDLVEFTDANEGRFAEIRKDTNGDIITPLSAVLKKYGYEKETSKIYDETLKDKSGNIGISTEELQKFISEGGSKNNQMQIMILGQFLEWQTKGKELNEVVKVSKADVDGATKNQATAKLAENLLNKVVTDNKIGNVDKLLGYDIVDNEVVFNNTRMTGTYYENSIRAARQMYKGLFVSNSPAAETLTDLMSSLSGYVHLVPNAEHESIVNDLANEQYALTATDTSAFELLQEEDKSKGLTGSQVGLHELLFGSTDQEALAVRVLAAKNGEHKDNVLVRSLEVRPGDKLTPGTIFLPNSETVKEAKDDLYLAWEELKADNHDLADDLMLYSFYASGMTKAVGSFYEHIPMSFLSDKHYSDQIQNKIGEYSNPNALISQMDNIYKHLSENDKLIPTVSDKVLTEMKTLDDKVKVRTSDGFILTPEDGENYIAGIDANGDPVFKRFVKRVFKSKDEFENTIKITNLFQLVGMTAGGNAVYTKTNKLGYKKKGVVIKEYNGTGDVSIFRENNVSLPTNILPYLNNTMPVQVPVSPYDATQKKDAEVTMTKEEANESLKFCSI